MNEQVTEHFIWNFPFGIWGIVTLAVILIATVGISYHYIIPKIATYKRVILATLRTLICLTLLICLANPHIRTERTISDRKDAKVAVIFDESLSMNKLDRWKRSRYEDALSFWQEQVIKDVDRQSFDFYRFGNTLHATPQADSPPEMTNQDETNFYEAIANWNSQFMAQNYDGVICFTDAIDTSQTSPEVALKALNSSGITHIFVPMTNELSTPPDIRFRKIESPSVTLPNSQNELVFLINCNNISSGSMPKFELLKNGETVYSKDIQSGSGIRMFKYPYTSGLAGVDKFSSKIINNQQVCDYANWSVETKEPKKSINVILFNGALDFGTRFLRSAFEEDNSIELDIRFANGVFPIVKPFSTKFPDADDLSTTDVLILMNIRRDELPERAEEDIYEFVRKGGGLLFITGNPELASEYAQSQLEGLLPVTFKPILSAESRTTDDTQNVLGGIASGTKPTVYDSKIIRDKEFTFEPEPLYQYRLTEQGENSPLFSHQDINGKSTPILPQFQDVALVQSLKPGANLLAYRTINRQQNPLLAYQNFGLGRSMVMATDPLWRWRLNLPSTNKAYEIFWKNLLSYLSTGGNSQLRWVVSDYAIEGGVIQLYLVTGGAIPKTSLLECVVEANGEDKTLPLSLEDGRFYCSFPVESDTEYIVRAIYDKKPVAELSFSANIEDSGKLEETILEPNTAVLEEFATLPHVKILRDSKLELADYFNRQDILLKESSTQPLWHQLWVYILLVVLLIGELILRRIWKLI